MNLTLGLTKTPLTEAVDEGSLRWRCWLCRMCWVGSASSSEGLSLQFVYWL